VSEAAASRLVLRGAAATGAGFALRLGARLGMLFLAGRLFGPRAFGAYALGVAAVESGVGLAGLSLKRVLFQLLDDNRAAGEAARPDTHIVLDACALVLVAGAGVAALIMAGACVAAGGWPARGPYAALFWLAPMVMGQVLADVLLAASRWKHLIRYEVVGRSLVEPYTQVAVALAGWWAGWSTAALIVAYWAGNLTLNLYALAGVRRGFGPFGLAGYRLHPARLRAIARGLVPNTATELLGGLYSRLDLYLVGALMGPRWAGYYAMAQQVRTPIKQVRQSFDGLLVPLVARTLARDGAATTGRSLASAGRLLLAIQLPVLAALIAFGAPLLRLFGPGIEAAATALALLAAAEVVAASLGLGDLLLVYLAAGAGLRMAALTFACGLACVAVLTPLYGLDGAAGAMLLATLLQALIRRHYLWRRFEHRVPVLFSAGPVVAAAVAVATMLAVRGPADASFAWRDLLALAAGLAIYAGLLAAWLRASGERLRITGLSTS
jgi:O-antigen/teichoic acid export membrane protein